MLKGDATLVAALMRIAAMTESIFESEPGAGRKADS